MDSNRKDTYQIMANAEAELDAIVSYFVFELGLPHIAKQIIDLLMQSMRKLTIEPYIAPFMDEPEFRDKGIRRLVVEKHKIFYIVNEAKAQIEIIHILHERQDYQRVLGDKITTD